MKRIHELPKRLTCPFPLLELKCRDDSPNLKRTLLTLMKASFIGSSSFAREHFLILKLYSHKHKKTNGIFEKSFHSVF